MTIADLGILRDVKQDADKAVEVVITPTYSGCPAMDVIREDIERELAVDGFEDVTVTTVLSPPWTTDWMTEDGKRKLRDYGIAPPQHVASGPVSVTIGMRALTDEVRCPQCGGPGRESSRFGSTACKALYICKQCQEPFDYFKPL